MAIQDNSWSQEESLVVAVPKGYGGHTLPSSGAAACDGQLDYMCRNIVNRDTKLICTIHG